jgi:xylem cysteine proteinase
MEPKLAMLFVFLTFVVCSTSHPDPSVVGYSQEDLAVPNIILDLFASWSVNHSKTYASSKEKVKRYEVFKQNLMHITETNREWELLAGLEPVCRHVSRRV